MAHSFWGNRWQTKTQSVILAVAGVHAFNDISRTVLINSSTSLSVHKNICLTSHSGTFENIQTDSGK